LDGISRNSPTSDASSCQCPLEPLFRAVTETEMINAYDMALSPLSMVLGCWDLVEVKKVNALQISNNLKQKLKSHSSVMVLSC
jgi:hypothetical protein